MYFHYQHEPELIIYFWISNESFNDWACIIWVKTEYKVYVYKIYMVNNAIVFIRMST